MNNRKAFGRSGIALRAEYAAAELRKAKHLETRPAFDATDAFFKAREAADARKEADRLLTPPKDLIGSAETELVPTIEPGKTAPAVRLNMVCTLADPNTISVDASEQRAMAATRVGVLSPALDAIVTANARNSIEKMLCHQLAAVHDAGMDLLIRVRETALMGQLPIAEVVRLTNGAARLFDTYQTGCLTPAEAEDGREAARRRAVPTTGERLEWRPSRGCRQGQARGIPQEGGAHQKWSLNPMHSGAAG
jgi:hypothetical protein